MGGGSQHAPCVAAFFGTKLLEPVELSALTSKRRDLSVSPASSVRFDDLLEKGLYTLLVTMMTCADMSAGWYEEAVQALIASTGSISASGGESPAEASTSEQTRPAVGSLWSGLSL